MTNLEKGILKEMIEHLKDMEDQSIYVGDLSYLLFENENINGSYTNSAYEANQWIKAHWNDLGGIVEEYENELGAEPENPFRYPESFQVQIILFVASRLVAISAYIVEHWDEYIELTKDTIILIASEWKANL